MAFITDPATKFDFQPADFVPFKDKAVCVLGCHTALAFFACVIFGGNRTALVVGQLCQMIEHNVLRTIFFYFYDSYFIIT